MIRLFLIHLMLPVLLCGFVVVHPSFFRRHASIDTTASSIGQLPVEEEGVTEVSLRCLTFANLPKETEPGLVCDLLMEVGACSTAIIDADRGTQHEQPLFGEPSADVDPWQDSLHWAAPIWNRCNVTAHFPASVDIPSTVALVRDTLDIPALRCDDSSGRSAYTVEQIPNKDWVVHVQQSWTPIVVADKYVLRFPWHSDEDVADAAQGTYDLLELQLQGGIAFGTGEHPTTQLCLEWLYGVVSDKLLRERLSTDNESAQINILDYGSGSGVLGMGACALSPLVKAVGVDIDVDACRIANANSETNGLNMQSYLPPLTGENTDDESMSLMLKAHEYAKKQLDQRGEVGDDLILPPEKATTKYDFCVANILAGPLVTLAPTLASMMQPGAALGISGILPQQGDMVIEAYRAAGFENVGVAKELGGWILVTATKP